MQMQRTKMEVMTVDYFVKPMLQIEQRVMTHQILNMTKVACVGIWWSVSKKENWLFFQEIQGISTVEEIHIQKL